MFSRLLRHPAWKQRGPILVLALHKSVNYLLRHLPTYLQAGNPHKASTTLVIHVIWKQIHQYPTYNGTLSNALAKWHILHNTNLLLSMISTQLDCN